MFELGMDYLIGNQTTNEAFNALKQVGFDPGFYRPYWNEEGRRCVALRTGKMVKNKAGFEVPELEEVRITDLLSSRDMNQLPVFNQTTMTKDAWIKLDTAVVHAARKRLRLWSNLAAEVPVSFDGFGKATWEYQADTDEGSAMMDMDGLTEDRDDATLFNLRSTPLPLVHSGFKLAKRFLEISRNGNQPLDTSKAEKAGRRMAELVEKVTIGIETGLTYGPNSSSDTRYTGTSKVYGMTNFPQRLTKTDLTAPSGSNQDAIHEDVVEMIETMYDNGYYGPFALYYTPAYDRYFNVPYAKSGVVSTGRLLREQIASIENLKSMLRLDFWTGSAYQMCLVQVEPNTVQALMGMPFTTIQWESKGGLLRHFKSMAMMTALWKSEFSGKAPILHATTS
jgi:uncharacterized linocin/CFP29 family protein